ncbi:lysophospholipid acyltransferase family protein [Oryzibacter oryziterrae]|uniref:lysophospholipid acyltransferase family protein n=1 Tax=Oryzibacter oryziterrae TaxID=2766474 RepID=UPI001F3BCFA2|nr:lauroyl acyltransferase [Oryzibacter oryziterrae]
MSHSSTQPQDHPVSLKHRLEYAVLRSVVGLLRLMGPDRASAFMGFAWRHLAPFNARHVRAENHLALAMPELDAKARRRLLGDMWENLGRTAAEALLIEEIIADRSRFEIGDDVAALLRGLGEQSAILCSLHQGNWEVVTWGARLLDRKVAAVYRRLRNPLSDAYVRQTRLPLYDGGLIEAGGVSPLKLRSMAKAGACVAMISDLPDRTGLILPFMGRPARLSPLPVFLGRKLGLPVIAARAVRTKGVRYRIEASRIDIPKTADAAKDIEAGTAALHGVFERWILQDPAQWMWAIKKWPRGGAVPVPDESD